MNLFAALSFIIIMLALAALPSASVALVVTSSATQGIRNGVAAAIGIVAGDLVLIALVLLGLSVLAETMGIFFAILKYAGGAYLIWLGYSLLRANTGSDKLTQQGGPGSLFASAFAGLMLTLGDLKAILFYASLFPSLFDLSELTETDIAFVVATTVFTVGGVKLIYALAARRLAVRVSSPKLHRSTRTLGGGMLVGMGAYLIVSK